MCTDTWDLMGFIYTSRGNWKKKWLSHYPSYQFHLVPNNIMNQIFLGAMLRHMENQEVTDDSQYGCTKGELLLTNSVAFSDMITEVMNQGEVTNIIYLELCKVFEYVPNDIFASKLERHRFDGWIT